MIGHYCFFAECFVSPPYPLDFTDPNLIALYQNLGVPDTALDQGCQSINYRDSKNWPAPEIVRGKNDNRIQSCELFETHSPQFPAAYQKFSGESLPWSPSPQNSNTQQVLKNFDGNIAQWRQINHLPNGANLSLALNIYSWFIQRGIKADPNAPEQNFDEAIISSKAHCSNFFKDLYALYSREGFSPHSEFVKVDQKGV